jgi:hypothetical protein
VVRIDTEGALHMNKAGKRLLVGGVATAAVALGVGGLAYANGTEGPSSETGYVTIEDSPGTTQESPGTTQETPGTQGQRQDGDCPDKGGSSGQNQQGQQGEQTQPQQESNPEGQA